MLYGMTASSPIFGLRREIDRLFEDTFTRDGSSWTPPVDIRESGNDLRIDLELAGLKPEDVEITAENGVLSIRGEKRNERKEGDDSRYHLVERTYGGFLRTFTLPQGVDENQIQAEFDNGLLSIRIPKAALPQPKRIEISAGSEKRQGTVSGSAPGSSGQPSAKNPARQSSTTTQRERGREQMAAESAGQNR